jgi:predicted nucleotidyltransferase
VRVPAVVEADRRAGLPSEALTREFGARRVWLVGSLARGWVVHRDSDIDLVVEGLRDADYFSAWTRAEQLTPGFRVDLIPKESANARILRDLSDEGLLLAGDAE